MLDKLVKLQLTQKVCFMMRFSKIDKIHEQFINDYLEAISNGSSWDYIFHMPSFLALTERERAALKKVIGNKKTYLS